MKKMFLRTKNVMHGRNGAAQTKMGEGDRNDLKKKRKHEVKPITMRQKTDVIRWINERKWESLLKLLRSKKGKKICLLKDSTELNILGMALGSRPPSDVIALILNLNPALVHQPDENGAFPLHIGCLNGISVDNLLQIVKVGSNKITRAQDSRHHTVLHHAVEYSCTMSKKNSIHSSLISIMYEESVEVIEHLLSMAPETIHYSNDTGVTPLDIPHTYKTRGYEEHYSSRLDEVYRLLKETSIEQYKIRKRMWEEVGYNTEVTKESSSSVPPSLGLESSCSTATVSRVDLYHGLDKMSISSSEPKKR